MSTGLARDVREEREGRGVVVGRLTSQLYNLVSTIYVTTLYMQQHYISIIVNIYFYLNLLEYSLILYQTIRYTKCLTGNK